MLLPLRARSAP